MREEECHEATTDLRVLDDDNTRRQRTAELPAIRDSWYTTALRDEFVEQRACTTPFDGPEGPLDVAAAKCKLRRLIEQRRRTVEDPDLLPPFDRMTPLLLEDSNPSVVILQGIGRSLHCSESAAALEVELRESE